MSSDRFENYNQKRNELFKKYKDKKLKEVFGILGIGAAVIAILALLFAFDAINEAVLLVVSAVSVMISVIFARIRIVTINHVRDEKLRLFEDENDPTF